MPQDKMKTSKKASWKKSAGFVLSFVLFLGICGMFFSLDLWLGFLNKQSVVTAVADSQYSARAYEQLREDMEALMKAHNLESEAALALLDENSFYTANGNLITATLKGETSRINTTSFRSDLSTEIKSYLKDYGVPQTAEITVSIEEVVFTAGNLYDNHTYFQFGEQLFKARSNMVPMVRNMFFVSLGMTVVIGLALMVFYRRRHTAIGYINYALFGAALANLLVVGLLYVTNPLGDAVTAIYYQNFIEHYLAQSLIPGIGLSSIGLIVTAILWMTIRRIQEEA